MRLSDLMTPTVIAAHANQNVEEARELMHLYRVDHLPVYAGAELRGVVTLDDVYPKRDLAPELLRALSLEDLLATASPRRATIASVLTTIDEARVLLADRADGFVLVRDGGDVVGIVTRGNLLDLGDSTSAGRHTPRARLTGEAHELVGEDIVVTELRDISSTGIRLATGAAALRVGACVGLAWALPDDAEVLWGGGRVVRRTDVAEHAVEFTSLSEATRRRIDDFVKAALTEGQAPCTSTRSRPSALAR